MLMFMTRSLSKLRFFNAGNAPNEMWPLVTSGSSRRRNRVRRNKNIKAKNVILREHSTLGNYLLKNDIEGAAAAQRRLAGEPKAKPGALLPRTEISQFLPASRFIHLTFRGRSLLIFSSDWNGSFSFFFFRLLIRISLLKMNSIAVLGQKLGK